MPYNLGRLPSEKVVTARNLTESEINLLLISGLVDSLKDDLGIPQFTFIDITLLTENTMSDLRVRYIGLPGPTDVLSFPALDTSIGLINSETLQDEPTLGDIVICPSFIERTTGDASGKVNIESCVIHGLLHLLGYDHQTATDAKVMFEKEEALMLSWQKSKNCKP